MGSNSGISVVGKVTFVLILVSAAVISFFALQIPSKETNWTEYQHAQFCSEFSCRQILTAMILKSQTVGRIIKEKAAQTQTDTDYYVQIQFDDHRVNEFYVTTKISVEKSMFGMPHIYIPQKTERNFMGINFPAGRKTNLELWKGLVTFMFADYLGQQNSSPIPPSISEPDQTSIMNEFAIPTVNHPLVALKKAQKDLLDAVIAILVIVPITILLTHYYTRKKLVDWRPNARSH